LSAEERYQRKMNRKLLSQMGDQTEYDENGDIIYTGSDDPDQLEVVNQNAERVKNQQAVQREQAKKKHQDQVRQNKEALEKDRLRKEKAKRKTQKKEKRRGCG